MDGFFELIMQALGKARRFDYRGSAAFSCAINVRDPGGIRKPEQRSLMRRDGWCCFAPAGT